MAEQNKQPNKIVTLKSLQEYSTKVKNYIDGGIEGVGGDITNHINDKENPHVVTKGQVGLGSVVNTGDSGTPTQSGVEKFTTGGAYTMQQALIGEINDLAGTGRTSETVKGNATEISSHKLNTSNPHTVTKTQVGLGKVDNKSVSEIKEEFTGTIAEGNTGFATGGAVKSVVDELSGDGRTSETVKGNADNIISHTSNKNNPHVVTKEQVGLGNVANVLQYSADNPPPYPVVSVAGKTGAVPLEKSDVGLGNVDNKSVVTIKSEFTGEIKENNDGFVTGGDAKSAIDTAKSGAEATAKGYVDALAGEGRTTETVKSNADAISIINGVETQAGSIAKALADAKAYTDSREDALELLIDAADDKAVNAQTTADNHIADKANPHEVTAAQVGLGKVENKSVSDIKGELKGSIATNNTGFVTGGDAYTSISQIQNRLGMTDTVEGSVSKRVKTLEGTVASLNAATTFAGTGTYSAMQSLTDVKAGSIYVVVDDTESGKQYNNKEFVYDGSKWVELGDTTAEAHRITELEKTVSDITDRTDGLDDSILYTNDTPIVVPIGSIEEGETFTDIPITEMLTKILYPYTEISVGDPVFSQRATSYTIPNYPTLSSVSLYVKKNSAKNLSFTLYETTSGTDVQLGKTLTEQDISNNTLVFNDFQSKQLKVNSAFKIRYSYTGKGGATITPDAKVGNYTLTFTTPTMGVVSSTVDKSSPYNGQTATVSSVYVTLSDLGSAEGVGDVSVKLYKDGVEQSVTPTVTSVSGGKKYSFTVSHALTSSTKYTIKAFYKSRTGSSEALTDKTLEGYKTIQFTHINATVNLSATGGGSYPRTNTASLSNLKATITKYSDKITKLVLKDGQTNKEEIDLSGDTTNYNNTTYISTSNTKTFNTSYTNLTSNKTLKAEVETANGPRYSSEVSVSFYDPYCYGYVADGTTIDQVLTSLGNDSFIKSSSAPASGTITLPVTGADAKHAVLACPVSSESSRKYSSIQDLTNNLPATNSFTEYHKQVTFTDGSKKWYQIFMLTIAAQSGTDGMKFKFA